MDEIEFEDPRSSTCGCCGSRTTRLARFVYREGSAFAVYNLMFSDGPKHFWIDGIAIFGNWGDDAILDQRVCFTFRMWTVAGINNVGLIDAAESPWHDSTLGRLLTRAQALEHPLKQQLFGLTDQIAVRDQRVVEFLEANSLPHAPNAQH